jgi:putative ABC transport system permease protein
VISEYLTAGLALLTAGSVVAMLVCLVAAVPWAGFQALSVIVNREWIPPIYAIRSIVKRRGMMFGTLLSLALVTFVLTTLLMLADGIRQTLVTTGNTQNAKVMLRGIASEGSSFLTRSQVNLLTALTDVATTKDGRRLIAPEAMALVWASAVGADPEAGTNLPMRGITPVSFELNPLKSLRGRRFKPGAFELIIGKAVEGKLQGATLGGQMTLAGHEWTVVGVADHGGNAYDSEAWTDIDQIRTIFKREASVVTVALRGDDSLDSVRAILASSPALNNLQIRREADYWESLGRRYVDFLRLMGGLVGIIFGSAAVLGAMNTMNAQVSSRTRELGALRALGFRPRAILTALLFESVLLGALGGSMGVAAASLLRGVELRLTSEKTLTEMSFAFRFSFLIALCCLGSAAFIGFAGGLLPALKASRMRIVDAVRTD